MTIQYVMKATHINSPPLGTVYWVVTGTADMTGTFSGYNPADLTSIAVDYSTDLAVIFTGGNTTGLPTGAATGDLDGYYPNPTVAKLQGYDVDSAAPSDGYVLTWNDGLDKWQAEPTGTSTGGAGTLLPVRFICPAQVTLSGIPTSSLTDFITAVSGDRTLIIGQTSAAENGIYVVSAGAWSRASDFATSAQAISGLTTTATDGYYYRNIVYQFRTTNAPASFTMGTTAQSWKQQLGAASRRVLPYPVTPKLYWPLDQPTTALDQIITGNTLPFTLTGSNIIASSDDASILGTGAVYSFGASSGTYLATAHTTYQPASTAMVVGCWLQVVGFNSGSQFVWGYFDGATMKHGLKLSSAGVLTAVMTTGSSGLVTTTGAPAITPGGLYYVVCSYSPGDGRVRIEVNGFEAGSATGGGGLLWGTSGNRRWALFNDPNVGGATTITIGLIEDFAIWDEYFTVDRRAIYMRGIGLGGRD